MTTNSALLTPFAVRIADAYDDGEDARHYRFEALDASQARPALPGQFFMLSVPGYGEAAFSYARLPDSHGRFEALIRQVGGLTGALFRLDGGAVLGARGPFGRGFPLQLMQSSHVLVVAGGCGLASLATAIDALAEDAGGRIALIYGSRTEATQVLSRERARWAEKLQVFCTYDRPARAAHLPGTPLTMLSEARRALAGRIDHALICGPQAMMLATAEALAAQGVAHDRIWLVLERRMHCGVGLCGHCYFAHTYVCKQGPSYRYDELLRFEGKSPRRSPVVTDIHHC